MAPGENRPALMDLEMSDASDKGDPLSMSGAATSGKFSCSDDFTDEVNLVQYFNKILLSNINF